MVPGQSHHPGAFSPLLCVPYSGIWASGGLSLHKGGNGEWLAGFTELWDCRIVNSHNCRISWGGRDPCGSSSPVPGRLAVGMSPTNLGAPFLLQVRWLLPGRRQLPGPAVGSRGGSGSAGAPGAAQHHPGTAGLSPWLSSGVPVLGDPSSPCVSVPRAAPRIGSWPTSAASLRVWMPAGTSRCAHGWGSLRGESWGAAGM